MNHLIETIVGLTEKAMQAGAWAGVVPNSWATGAYGAEKLAQDLREYKDGKLDKAEVAGQAVNALSDYEITGYLENRGWSAPVAKTVGLVMSWLAGRFIEGIAHKLFGTNTPTDKALDEVNQVEEAKKKGNFAGNSVHGIGGAIDKAANVIDVVPLAGLASAPVELFSTAVKVSGDAFNLQGGAMVHDTLQGIGKTGAFVFEDVLPGSRYVNAGVGVVSGTTVATRAGKGLDRLVTGNK